MKLKIDFKIIFFALFFCITKQIRYYIIIMLFASIHECAHLITGLIMGFKVKKFQIMPVGLTLSFKDDINGYNKKVLNGNILCLKKIIILFAGPAINLVIAIIFFYFELDISYISREEIIYSNLLIAIFNMLPIYPLDGGRIIKRILHIFCGLKKSIQFTLIISNITTIILNSILLFMIYLSQNLALAFILFYLTIIVIIENKRIKMKLKMYKILDKILQ